MVAVEYGPKGDHWRTTEAGARVLFERVFGPADLEIRAHGNVLTNAAFLYGLCCDDLTPEEFAVNDPAYPMLITVRARKPATATRPAGSAPSKPAAAVLLYHRVADLPRDTHALAISPSAFRSQVEHLCKSWRVLPLRELAAAAAMGEPPDRAIALTFDDGYLDNLQIAAPILAELGVPATFFLTAESMTIRRRFWWDVLEEILLWDKRCPAQIKIRIRGQLRFFDTRDEAGRRAAHDELYGIFKAAAPAVRDDMLFQLARQAVVSPLTEEHRPLLGDEVLRLGAYPLIEVGGHGLHHLSLSGLSPEDCHREVSESRSALERLTGQSVTSFAYPFGDVSPEAVSAVMAAGFCDAVTCEPRGLRAREHPLRIPRIATREESGSELGARLAELLKGQPASVPD
jgi:peptidoglycan/xylan/chitin deacetylase (PgdA/CDA1 family)